MWRSWSLKSSYTRNAQVSSYEQILRTVPAVLKEMFITLIYA